MGNVCINSCLKDPVETPVIQRQPEKEIIHSAQTIDKLEIDRLKTELEQNPKLFILNQILLSVQFYENFERDKQSWNHQDKGKTAIDKITPDQIFDTINHNLCYRHRHGKKKNKTEPVLPKRTFVVSDLIEIVDTGNVYSAIDKPVVYATVEDSNNKGYLKLKCNENRSSPEPVVTNPEVPKASTSNDEIYTYTTITALNTPQTIEIKSVSNRRSTLPKFCFTNRKVENLDAITTDLDDEYEKPAKKIEMYTTITYINSKEFMTYFQSVIFPSSIAPGLHLKLEEIQAAKAIIGKVFCSTKNDAFSVIPCQIIPGISMRCPNIYEFTDRTDRPTVEYLDKKYRWITSDLILEICAQECLLVPKGFHPKKGVNNDSDIEWEMVFPRAERLLDSTLTQTKIKAFVIIVLIYKTYIQPETKQQGLLFEHIRTFMYWQFEAKPRDWSGHGLGYKIIDLLKNFNRHLSIHQLPDFICRNKNTFENITKANLQFAQKIFHRVIESPVLYLIGALCNLQNLNPRFYPELNWHQLYDLITNKRILQGPSIPINLLKRKPRKIIDGSTNYRKKMKHKEMLIHEERQKIMQKREADRRAQEQLENERKTSVDSLSFTGSMLKDSDFDAMQNGPLLKFFIKHLIDTAKCSRKLSTKNQTLFFLKQAWFLANLLENFDAIASRSLLAEIKKEEDSTHGGIVARSSISYDKAPTTPPRNSVQFNFDFKKRNSKYLPPQIDS